MVKRLDKKSGKHLRMSDVRAVAQLATQAATGATRITEGVHQSIWNTLGISGRQQPEQTKGVTGAVYKSIYAITQLVGGSANIALEKLESLLQPDTQPDTFEREVVLAALNGLIGDQLQRNANPLATPMSFRYQSEALSCQPSPTIPNTKSKALLLIHGLFMTDVQWQTECEGKDFDHGKIIASALNYSPVYLRYNTGAHISTNGKALSLKLEELTKSWPTPIEELAVVAYSMGGLLIRSALYYASQQSLTWPQLLKNIVFLGVPHHGAPLARASNWLDAVLGVTPYTRPFIRLSRQRSEGIMDLRHGYLTDKDWQGHDLFESAPDNRHIIPLPEGVACHTIAATTGTESGLLAERLVGDGLVPLNSALGLHDENEKTLAFEKTSQKVMYKTNHLALLSSPDVALQILRWLEA